MDEVTAFRSEDKKFTARKFPIKTKIIPTRYHDLSVVSSEVWTQAAGIFDIADVQYPSPHSPVSESWQQAARVLDFSKRASKVGTAYENNSHEAHEKAVPIPCNKSNVI